jgi:fused signal recognition particle receptor
MSFFNKLRDRLTRSSGKIGAGLDGLVADTADTPAKPGLLGRVFGSGRNLDDAMIEQLEDVLIAADMGTTTAAKVAANVAAGRMGQRLSSAELRGLVSDEIARIMEPVARPMPI